MTRRAHGASKKKKTRSIFNMPAYYIGRLSKFAALSRECFSDRQCLFLIMFASCANLMIGAFRAETLLARNFQSYLGPQKTVYYLRIAAIHGVGFFVSTTSTDAESCAKIELTKKIERQASVIATWQRSSLFMFLQKSRSLVLDHANRMFYRNINIVVQSAYYVGFLPVLLYHTGQAFEKIALYAATIIGVYVITGHFIGRGVHASEAKYSECTRKINSLISLLAHKSTQPSSSVDTGASKARRPLSEGSMRPSPAEHTRGPDTLPQEPLSKIKPPKEPPTNTPTQISPSDDLAQEITRRRTRVFRQLEKSISAKANIYKYKAMGQFIVSMIAEIAIVSIIPLLTNQSWQPNVFFVSFLAREMIQIGTSLYYLCSSHIPELVDSSEQMQKDMRDMSRIHRVAIVTSSSPRGSAEPQRD